MAAQPKREKVRILRTTPANGWLAVYAVRGEEGGRAKIEQERISAFALCEDEKGDRFVSGIREDNELCVMRDDFVGHFSIKKGRHKIREAAEKFVRAGAQERGEII
jgi:hypothetical protein